MRVHVLRPVALTTLVVPLVAHTAPPPLPYTLNCQIFNSPAAPLHRCRRSKHLLDIPISFARWKVHRTTPTPSTADKLLQGTRYRFVRV